MEAIVFLFVNATKIYQFRAKDSEIKKCPLCLRNISGDFLATNIKKKKQDYMGVFRIFLFETSDIIDIHKYLMKKHNIK